MSSLITQFSILVINVASQKPQSFTSFIDFDERIQLVARTDSFHEINIESDRHMIDCRFSVEQNTQRSCHIHDGRHCSAMNRTEEITEFVADRDFLLNYQIAPSRLAPFRVICVL